MYQALSSKELFINKKDVPPYDPKKDFWEQSTDVIQFFQEEIEKIKGGVNIGGYWFHPWLYFHINFAKFLIPELDNYGDVTDVLKTPPLDDNVLLIADSLKRAKDEGKGLVMFGTRGFAKSQDLTSIMHHTSLIKPGGNFKTIGGSILDLDDLRRMLKTSLDNIHPAFNLHTLINNGEKIELGQKLKDNTKFIQQTITIINADAEKEKSSEKGAGGNPSGFILDEGGKFDCTKVLESALASFKTPKGYRVIPILAGTSGNLVTAQGIRQVLENPKKYGMIDIDFDRLDYGVDPEYITWKEDRGKKFSVFVPGQMSYRINTPKIEKTLAEFTGNRSPELNKIKVNVTDWKNATEEIKSYTEDGEDDNGKNRMYYPLNIDDVWANKMSSPFPRDVIKRRIQELKKEGLKGQPVTLNYKESSIVSSFSDKRLAKTYYPGDVADHPTLIYENIPTELPPKYMYISGLDHYAQDNVAKEGSFGSLIAVKRRNMELGEPCEKIVLNYTARPETHRVFNQECEKGIKAFNAECCMESVNLSFQQYLEGKGTAQDYLVPAFDFKQGNEAGKKNKNLNHRYGVQPHAGTNAVRLNHLFDWAKEEHLVGIDDNGNEIYKLSVEFIEDIDILQEMLDYKKGGNYDRLTALSYALLLCREYDRLDKQPKRPKPKKSESPYSKAKKPRAKVSAYGTTRVRAY
jgi:hypothetical protein